MTDNLDPAPETPDATTSTALTLQQHAMQELDAVAAGIADLTKKYDGVVYDVTTTKGMTEAKAARKEIRDVRYAVENTRKDKGAELKRIAGAINARAEEITAPIRALEDPIDSQIKAEEDRKEAERAERQRQEQERIAGMNARLDNIRNMPLHAVGANTEEIQQALEKLEADTLDGFDDVYLPTAQQTKDAALASLTKLLDERKALDEQAAELDRQRQEQARIDAEAARRAAMLFIVNAPDGSRWAVPVLTIARARAAAYAHEFDGDVERSLNEDTMPLFEESPFEVQDWAVNNMNWTDVKADAYVYAPAVPITDDDMQEAWMSGDKEVLIPAAKA